MYGKGNTVFPRDGWDRKADTMFERTLAMLERSVGDINSRVDDLHASFQPTLKRPLPSASGQHLGFHHQILGVYTHISTFFF